MKDFNKHYPSLSAPERAALAIEALARGDVAEANHLTQTCPQRRYNSPDLRFGLRLSTLHRAALIYQAKVLWLAVRAAVLLGQLAYGLEPGDARLDAAMLQLEGAMSRIRGLHAAWVAFCSEVGFDPEATLAAYGISFSALERGVAFDADREAQPGADPVSQGELQEALHEIWLVVEDRR